MAGVAVEAGREQWMTRYWRAWRLGLAAGLLLLAGATLLVGERPGSADSLAAALRTGRVDAVQVQGALGPGESGFAAVQVHWRDGVVRRVTELHQVTPGAQVQVASSGTAPVVEDVDAWLAAARPGIRIAHQPLEYGVSGKVLGWAAPWWVGLASLIVFLGLLHVVFSGPQPYRATRWAWFWLLFSPAVLVAGPVFLLLGGPVPGIPAPGPRSRRLTGGWAFLLAALVSSASWSG